MFLAVKLLILNLLCQEFTTWVSTKGKVAENYTKQMEKECKNNFFNMGCTLC